MDLPHTARIDSDDSSGDVASDGESERIDDLYRPTGDFMGRLFREMIGIALGARNKTGRCGGVLLVDVCRGGSSLEDVEFVVRNVVEG